MGRPLACSAVFLPHRHTCACFCTSRVQRRCAPQPCSAGLSPCTHTHTRAHTRHVHMGFYRFLMRCKGGAVFFCVRAFWCCTAEVPRCRLAPGGGGILGMRALPAWMCLPHES